MVIQLERKHNDAWKSFNCIDELFLKLICNFIEFKLGYESYNQTLQIYKLKEESVVNTFTSLLTARSQYHLLKLIRKLLPKYHGFEYADLLFYEASDNKLYSVVESDKEEYPQTIYFLPKLGISGEIVRDKKIKIMEPTTMNKFNGEVDGIKGVKTIKSILYGPVFQDYPENKRMIGIVQLINKKDEGEVKVSNIEFFKQMSGFYGLLILKVVERQNILNMTIQMKNSTKLINNILLSKGELHTDYSSLNMGRALDNISDFLDKLESDKQNEH